MSDLPDFLTEGDGYIDITLRTPALIAGVKTSTLRMREPTVGDQLVARKGKGDDAETEIALVANLLEISPADVAALSTRNYSRIQRAVLAFRD